jgi:hypothetical protein
MACGLAAALLFGCVAERAPSAQPSRGPDSAEVAASPTRSAAASESPVPVELETPPPLSMDDIPLMCGSPLSFSAAALGAIRGAESANHPAARSLRQLLADGSVPNRPGWQLVVLGDRGALFLLPGEPREGVDFWRAELGPEGENWAPVRWGACEIQPAFDGIEPARWELAPGEDVGPDTRTLEVLVFEQACASGASPEGRIVGPAVFRLEDSMTVILGTIAPPGPQTCVPGPPATVEVRLPEPLGNRALLDGSTFPAERRD